MITLRDFILYALLSGFQLALARDCQIEWDVDEAYDAQSKQGYCVTKNKAAQIQSKLEAQNQVASFLLVEDRVFCNPSALYCLVDVIPCHNGFESFCLDSDSKCVPSDYGSGEITTDGKACPPSTAGCCHGDVVRNSPQSSLGDINEQSPDIFEETDASPGYLNSDSSFPSSDLFGTESLLTDELAASSPDFQIAGTPDHELFSLDDQSVLLTSFDNNLFAPDESLSASSFMDKSSANDRASVDTIGPSWQDFVA